MTPNFIEFCEEFNLSEAEADVLALLLLGISNGLIARKLKRTIPSVKNTITNIYRKIGVGKDRQMYVVALLAGIFTESYLTEACSTYGVDFKDISIDQ